MKTEMKNLGVILSLYARLLSLVMVSAGFLAVHSAYCSEGQVRPAAQLQTTKNLIEQGLQLFKEGKNQEAQQVLLIALEQARATNDRLNEGWALKHLSALYPTFDEYDRALESANGSLAIARELGDLPLTRSALNVLGLAYYWQEDYPKAINAYIQALAIAAETPVENWKVLNNLGEAYYEKKEYQDAIVYYEKALTYLEKESNPQRYSLTLKNLGDALFWKGDYKNSIERFKRALEIDVISQEQRGRIHIALGNSYWLDGKFDNAANQFEKALALLGNSNDTFLRTNTLIALALVNMPLGNPEKAASTAHQAIEIAKNHNHSVLESRAWNILGRVLFDQNRLIKAIDAYKQGLALASSANSSKEKFAAATSLSFIYNKQGNFAAAHDAQELVSGLPDLGREINQLNRVHVGGLYIALGDHKRAIDFFKKNVKLADAGRDQAVRIDAHEKLGNAYYTGGFYSDAIKHYHRAFDLAVAENRPAQQASALANLAWAYRSISKLDRARSYAERSVKLSEQIGDPWVKADSLNALLQLQVLAQDANSVETANKLLALSKKYKNGYPISSAKDALGGAYELIEDYPQAIDLYQQVLTEAQQAQARADEGNALFTLGAAYRKAGNLKAAESALRQAMEIGESIRAGLGDRDRFKVSLLDKQRQTYQELQSVLIDQGKTNQALEVSEKGRARALAELLARRQSPESASTASIQAPTLPEMIAIAREQNATIVEYAVTLAAIFIWVIKPDGTIEFEKVDVFMPSAVLPAAAASTKLKERQTIVSQTISKVRGAIAIDDPAVTGTAEMEKQIDQGLRALYDMLIEPIAQHLPQRQEERIIFIPQRDLFQVPFPALKDKAGKYLIEKHTIQTATSIQLLKQTDSLRQSQLNSPKHKKLSKPLVVGNPTMPSISTASGSSGTTLTKLPGAEKEALAIAKLLDVPALTGAAATERTVTKILKTASLAHFATHGLLDYGVPELSGVRDIPGAIALAPDRTIKTTDGDGLLTSGEIMNLSLQAELVVLSACDTGKGDITADGVVGLSRALIAAGVPSIIVSLWSVPDTPTAKLMTEFYRNLRQKGDKARALRQAMLAMLETHPNPVDWAAFTLIGESL